MPHQFSSASALLRGVPVTLVFIVLSVCGFSLIYLNAPIEWLAALTYSGFEVVAGNVLFEPMGSQYWRLLTPIFLHFGWLHIAFNCLWLWEIGALVEQRLGSGLLLLLIVLAGVGSNTAQFTYGGPSLFGGMSGVVYGLIGFCWVYHALLPMRGLAVPKGIILFMLGWLVFCMVVPTQALGFGAVANAAHLGGLIIGCMLALLLAAPQKLRKQ